MPTEINSKKKQNKKYRPSVSKDMKTFLRSFKSFVVIEKKRSRDYQEMPIVPGNES